MAKFVRIRMPIRSPANTLTLAQAVLEKHVAEGAGSPLNGFVDMAAFALLVQQAAAHQSTGDEQSGLAQSLYNQLANLCGLAKGQNRRTPDMLLWRVLQVRDVLRIKYRGVEKELSTFGFHVVISQTSARRNLRIPVPVSSPQKLLRLAAEIFERHTELGAASPLTGQVDMAAFSALVTQSLSLLEQWDDAQAGMQSEHNRALNLLGYAKGQTASTTETIYYDLLSIRDRLKMVYAGIEQTMETWGFHVVISEKKNGRKKKLQVS